MRLILALSIVFYSPVILACSRPATYRPPSFQEMYSGAENVFFAKINQKTEMPPVSGKFGIRYKLVLGIEHTWKGKSGGSVEAFTNSSTCNPFGQDAAPNMTCLFFTSSAYEIFGAPICLNADAEKAKEERAKLEVDLKASSSPRAATEDKWFACDRDEDCVDISFHCAGGVVNKTFAKAAADYYKLQNARANCMVSPKKSGPEIPFKTFCQEKKCGKQGQNPKLGFS